MSLARVSLLLTLGAQGSLSPATPPEAGFHWSEFVYLHLGEFSEVFCGYEKNIDLASDFLCEHDNSAFSSFPDHWQ